MDEHDEKCEQREEEEHGICRAEGLHPLNQHGRPPLAVPRRIAAAHFRLTGALRRLDCSREENPQQSFTLGSHCDAHAGVQSMPAVIPKRREYL